MHSKSLTLAAILLAASAFAQQPKTYVSGKLLGMDSVQCGADKGIQNNLETANTSPAKEQPLCPEYVLETDQVTYRVISRNTKHPAPLPIGELAQFRWQNGKMLLRVPAFDSKEREYIVVSAMPRGQSAADANVIRLNHLQ